jgi:hypothetical protein
MTASRDRPSPTAGDARERWWCVGICAVTLLAYARSFYSPFELDDYSAIVGAPAIQAGTIDAILSFGRARILPFATLVLNYRLGAEEPFGYHVVNFAVHLLATLAVYRLALALCRTPRLRDTWVAAQRLPLAVATAFIFACHPIQIQAVTYVVQRFTSMATLFYIAAVLFYVRARNAQLGTGTGYPVAAFTASALAALAAFLSKESTASLPLAIVATEWIFFNGVSTRRRLALMAPFLLLVLVIPFMWRFFGYHPGTAPDASASLSEQLAYLIRQMTFRASAPGGATPLQYFLTQAQVIPAYLRLVILPVGFNVDHDVPIVRTLSPDVIGGLALLGGLLVFGLAALRRWPLVGFGVLWLFIALSVESSFLPISDAMVEHRMYLAMPGLALVGGTAFAWAYSRWPLSSAALGATAVALLVTLTVLRNEVWRSPVALWQDALAKSPDKPRVYANLGTALHLAGRRDEAVTYYCKALALDPKNGQVENNLQALQIEQLEDGDDDQQVAVEAVQPTGNDGEVEVTLPDPCHRNQKQ